MKPSTADEAEHGQSKLHLNNEDQQRYDEFRSSVSIKTCEPDEDNFNKPAWFDKERFQGGQRFARKYFFSLFFAHLTGLVLLVFVKSILVPLLSTGNSRSVAHLFGRYLRTLMHIKLWYEGDVWDRNHPASKSVKQVRQMHNTVSKKLNSDREANTGMSLSQYDMLVTQFSFIGLVILFPRRIGISCSDDELENLLHFWRAIGWLMGIEDSYNLCNGDLQTTRSLCSKILDNEIKPSIIFSPHEVAIEMSRGIIYSIKPYIRFLTWTSLTKFLFEIVEIKKDIRLSAFSSFCYFMLCLTFNYTAHFILTRLLLNQLLRLALVLATWRQRSIEKFLKRRYSVVLNQIAVENQ